MSKDTIYRQDAIDAANRADYTGLAIEDVKKVTDEVVKELKQLPSAQKTCRWTDKSIFYGDDVEEWQTCQCSECGRWDTRPYAYYFDEPNYCSYCGAKRQKGGANE